MRKRKTVGVQKNPALGMRRFASVLYIARHRATNRRQLYSYLMRPSGERLHLQERNASAHGQCFISQFRFLSVGMRTCVGRGFIFCFVFGKPAFLPFWDALRRAPNIFSSFLFFEIRRSCATRLWTSAQKRPPRSPVCRDDAPRREIRRRVFYILF